MIFLQQRLDLVNTKFTYLFFLVLAVAKIEIKSKHIVRTNITFSSTICDDSVWNLLKKYAASNKYCFMVLNAFCTNKNFYNLHFSPQHTLIVLFIVHHYNLFLL